MNKRLPLVVILFLPIIICLVVWYCWYSAVSTVILVRHAERLNDTDTTSISEAGIERAKALAHVLSASAITRIYVSEIARTAQTAAVAAAASGVTVVPIAAKEFKRYADSVKAHRGENILIVGHSNTVPQILEKLAVANPPTIASAEFDNLFVVTLFRFRTTMAHLKYGKPSIPQ